QHAASAMRALKPVSVDHPLILVGHSGAGPLLPAIRQMIPHRAAAYIFVDAGIPIDGASRLDLRALESPEMAQQSRQALVSGGCYPTWSDEDLLEVIPDAGLRQGMLAEMHPRPLAFFEEPIPVFSGWPDAPCGYLLFSPAAYAVPAARARRDGWAYRELDAGHFHMLVDPKAVANALRDLVEQMSIGVS
ncbi:MAG: alpha/beta fold hydrolase, partial [Gammaproteobacteria bacterium]